MHTDVNIENLALSPIDGTYPAGGKPMIVSEPKIVDWNYIKNYVQFQRSSRFVAV